jgi:hypothetical protein
MRRSSQDAHANIHRYGRRWDRGFRIAKAMAEGGAKVLVLEREKNSKIVYRGEGVVPWGVAEGNELGICGLLKETCAHDVPYVEAGTGLRDLRTTTLQQLPLLTSLRFSLFSAQPALMPPCCPLWDRKAQPLNGKFSSQGSQPASSDRPILQTSPP